MFLLLDLTLSMRFRHGVFTKLDIEELEKIQLLASKISNELYGPDFVERIKA